MMPASKEAWGDVGVMASAGDDDAGGSGGGGGGNGGGGGGDGGGDNDCDNDGRVRYDCEVRHLPATVANSCPCLQWQGNA
jgi:hypothetical protein